MAMLCQCYEPYNDNKNALLTSNNQCSIVFNVAYVFWPTQPAQDRVTTRPTTLNVARPKKKCWTAHNWLMPTVCRPLVWT